MLIQFRFANFKSFRDDTILDLSATKITEHADQVVQVGSEKLLPVAAIYGANAGGKSNVIEAFRFMATYVMNSFAYGGEGDNGKGPAKRPQLTPFLFDKESRDAPSMFEVYFTGPGEEDTKTYNYGFMVDREGVLEEWLSVKAKTARTPKMVFYRNRDKDELDLSGLSKKEQDVIKLSLYDETLVASLGAKQRVPIAVLVRDWFRRVDIANFGNPAENLVLSSIIREDFIQDEAVRRQAQEFLSAFDKGIVGFQTKRLESADNERRRVEVSSIHKMIDSDETVAIPLQEESGGTLKMFALFPVLREVLDAGGVLLVDELNAKLHPLLVRSLLIMFLDPATNPRHAQLIFTTHDSWQLSNDLLRRDEIWFVEKAESGVSSLYALVDFADPFGAKIRKDENYERNYLLGKYGAIPALERFDMFKGGQAHG